MTIQEHAHMRQAVHTLIQDGHMIYIIPDVFTPDRYLRETLDKLADAYAYLTEAAERMENFSAAMGLKGTLFVLDTEYSRIEHLLNVLAVMHQPAAIADLED